jgi:hypothetical protein
MVDRIAVEQVFLQVLRFSPVNTIPPLLHTHLHLHVAVIIRKNWWEKGSLPKSNYLSKIGKKCIEKNLLLFLLLEGLLLPKRCKIVRTNLCRTSLRKYVYTAYNLVFTGPTVVMVIYPKNCSTGHHSVCSAPKLNVGPPPNSNDCHDVASCDKTADNTGYGHVRTIIAMLLPHTRQQGTMLHKHLIWTGRAAGRRLQFVIIF